MGQVSLLGILFALVFYAVSASPSLLPRRWWWHGFVSGPLMALGYSIGWGIASLVPVLGQLSGVRVLGPPALGEALKWTAAGAVVTWTIWASVRAFISSRRAAKLVGIKPVGPAEYLLALLATAFMFTVTMAIVYMLAQIFELLVKILSNWLPWPASWLVALVFAITVALVISNKVVFRLIMAYFEKVAGSLNERSNSHLNVPGVPERSGSPDSSCSWESIGGQGRLFLGHGPSAAQIEAVTGRPAMEPVRIYVGMPADQTDPKPLAEIAVAELRRAGGFDRAVLVVYTATGSGWVDEWICQPLEYMTGGDCATVSIQYSYQFSAAMMVSDLGPCAEAGTALFEAIEKEVASLPESKRPLVIVAGESLGAYGSQAAFTSIEDFNERADGAIWVGSPNRSPLPKGLTAKRHKGSPEVAPVVDSGKHTRFIATPEHLERDLYGRDFGPWEFPRSVFVQHASDPVVRFSGDMLLKEPDWLRERVGPDVSPSMRYTPIVSYLQVVADLPVAGLAPAGHGHTYHRELLDVWVKVLGLDEPTAQGRVAAGTWLTPEMKGKISAATELDLKKYHKGIKAPAD